MTLVLRGFVFEPDVQLVCPAIEEEFGSAEARTVLTATSLGLGPLEASLFIENVGNLVCPAAFDLGEACKIVVFSTTEGEDKPLKYPDMFAASSLMLINKIDLAPVLDFDLARTIEYARRVSPKIEVSTVSARSGEGFAAFYAWIRKRIAQMKPTEMAVSGSA